jgi:hypothetical protein
MMLSDRILAGVTRRATVEALEQAVRLCDARAESLEASYDWSAASEATKCAAAIRRLAEEYRLVEKEAA